MARTDYYLVLGVDERSDDAEIREAYRRLARRYHPDINPEDERAAMRFKLISDAYRVLSDPALRAAYSAPLQSDQRAVHAAHSHAQPSFSGAGAAPPERPRVRPVAPRARWSALGWRALVDGTRGWLRMQQLGATAWQRMAPATAAAFSSKPRLQIFGEVKQAGLGRRLVASFIDVAALALGMLLFILAIGAIGAIFGLGTDGSSYSNTNDVLVLVLFFSPTYFITLWTLYGRTLGCVVTDLKLRQLNGDHLTVSVAALRWVCALLSCIPLFLGFLWLLRDDQGLAWHDHLSGSVVLQEQSERAEIQLP